MIRRLAKAALSAAASTGPLRLARLASPHQRRLMRYRALAERILALDHEHRALSDAALRERADELRRRARDGASLDALTIPTFALVREAARRRLGEAHVAEQLIGGLALRDGAIAEMKTGEGKTLTATLVCALHALNGRGVHVAVPNDYLATRDADWMRPVYAALGLSVGVITQDKDDDSRRAAYTCDITYGTASEFGLDFLRDQLKYTAAETVQRGHTFALVDEADATLIDDAGVPLALYGPLGDQSGLYQAIDAIVAALTPSHYELDARRRVALTEAGYAVVDHTLRQVGLLKPDGSLHDVTSITLLHHVIQALRAHVLLARDRDYVVQHGEVVIVDALTGRLLPGRRYDDALHQALEAKEACAIGEETRTLASITFQSYFRRYETLAGMTGTAHHDIDEFCQIYGLDVVAIPTHRPMLRRDEQVLHRSRADARTALLAELESAHARGQPVLIGTPSITACDDLAALLEAHGWRRSRTQGTRRFAILNARHHADEAAIIAQAGRPGAVTLATAMAGRGTDIKLGGSPFDAALHARAREAGGLLVIGTEHHPHRRRDAQLRGRAGRQGDPGRSVIHAALDDELLRDRPVPLAADVGRIHASIATRLVEAAQRRREAQSFDQRLAVMRFDAVIERQRDALIAQRHAVRDDPAPLQLIVQLRNDTIDDVMEKFAPPRGAWDIQSLDASVRSILTLAVPIDAPGERAEGEARLLRARIGALADDWMARKVDAIGETAVAAILRRVMLALIDQLWTEQTERLEHLKRMIGDRRLPAHRLLPEFEREAFTLFELLAKEFRHEVTAHAMRLGRP